MPPTQNLQTNPALAYKHLAINEAAGKAPSVVLNRIRMRDVQPAI